MNKKKVSKLAMGRAFHLIDTENLVGAGTFSEADVARVRAAYFELVKPGKMDQFFVASNHHNELATAFGWPEGQRRFLNGEDGADYLLVKRAIDLLREGNFNHVYVASGDHSMADYVGYLQHYGIKVTVVSLESCLSYNMRWSGAEVLYLEDQYQLAA
jgi:hypothetical protein